LWDGFLVLSLLAYVVAFVGIMLFIIVYDSHRAYNQREKLIAAFKELRVPGTNATAVAKAANDAAASYKGKPEQAGADAVAKAASDAASKDGGDTLIATFEKLIPSPEGMEGEGLNG